MILGCITFNFSRVAFRLHGLEIYWYGIFVCLGFLAGMWAMQREAKRRNLPPEDVVDLIMPIIIGGLLGARICYVLSNLDQFSGHWLDIVKIRQGGLVYYGGFIGASLAVAWGIHWKKLPFWPVADTLAAALPLGQALGRIGCLLNGCCFGKPCNLPFAIVYLPDRDAFIIQAHQGIINANTALACQPVWPAQLSQSLLDLLVFGSLLFLSSRVRGTGRILALYLILYPIARFTNEFSRGDYLVHYGGLTIAQVLSLIILPIGLILYRLRRPADLLTKEDE